ncbi:MAG: type II toxin-antitoxin system VapC family toxin [Chloroflexota bacterium]|nr:type II toxin-antitoxin system VapC family toxin [Chloroflexia bacterium]MDQ3225546.1 type II toxin-antitoxin system VapC family toxin [Chloroflexota bacterium]
MSYLLDTDWLVDIYIGRSDPARIVEELRPQGIGVSIVTHGELFEGAFGFPDTGARLARVYVLLARFDTMPLTDPIMEIFGRTRSELRRTGRLIPDMDLLIAATGIPHDLILLTRNLRHFTSIPELQIFRST